MFWLYQWETIKSTTSHISVIYLFCVDWIKLDQCFLGPRHQCQETTGGQRKEPLRAYPQGGGPWVRPWCSCNLSAAWRYVDVCSWDNGHKNNIFNKFTKTTLGNIKVCDIPFPKKQIAKSKNMNRETNMYVYMCVYMHAFMYVLIELYYSMYSSCEKMGRVTFNIWT